ncbi:MAG: glycosyltransferase family A protein [Geminicoccaceae bacterium]
MSTEPSIAVVIPCRDERHQLWRSLASVAAQSRAPAQVVVLDRGSTDGLADWLLARWPGVELRTVAGDADEECLTTQVRSLVAADHFVVLQSGDVWPRDHLASCDGSRAGMSLRALRATPDRDPTASLDAALASLDPSAATLVDLHAATRPLALIAMLGLACRLRAVGGSLRALTLAELTWPVIEADGETGPLLVGLSGALDLGRASEQLCIERLVLGARKRPVRLLLGGLRPTTPIMLSRLLDAVTAHPDLELWLGDEVSHRYAASLLGHDRLRMVAPAILGLGNLIDRLDTHPALGPDLVGRPAGAEPLESRALDHDAWWSGYDLASVRRLGAFLARALQLGEVVAGPVLNRAWLAMLVGWSAAKAEMAPVETPNPLLAMFAAQCGRSVRLARGADPKAADLSAAWPCRPGGRAASSPK